MHERLSKRVEPFASEPQLGAPTSEQDSTRRFWLGLLYASLVGYWAASPTVIGYAALTWDQPHRAWLVGIAIVALAHTVVIFGFRRRLIMTLWRVALFAAWNTLSFAVIVLICTLDGGVNSTLTVFLLLPMMSLALGYPLRAVHVSGLAGLASYAVLVGLSPRPVSATVVLLQAIALAIGWLLAVIGAVNRAQQSSELRRLHQQLGRQATTDELTGCLNQRGFKQALNREIARSARYGHSVALLLIDLDHFKRVNDYHGHLMGDEVLRQTGKLLRQTARQGDIAGRPGGDELALLAPETDRDDALALAERLLDGIHASDTPMRITVSIGIGVAAANTESAISLFQHADQALYLAKQRGRNQVAVCDTDRTFAS